MENTEWYQLTVESESGGLEAAGQAGSLATALREISGVIESERSKSENDTMDLGTIVTIVLSSGATLAVARGLADWLRLRRGTRFKLQLTTGAHRLKLQLDHIDPEVALRVVEATAGK
jgi:Effector Associated Constant Component 1